MKKNYYILSSGRLIRKNNTIYFEKGTTAEYVSDADEDEWGADDATHDEESIDGEDAAEITRVPIPVDSIEAIYCFSELRMNTRFINFCSQKRITVHFFNYYGYYTGSFYPREPFISGRLLVAQVKAYLDQEDRMILAKYFIKGASENIVRNLQRFNEQDRMQGTIEDIRELQRTALEVESIGELMGIEGNIRRIYYESWNMILGNEEFQFEKRERNPPKNAINALISFGNAMVYTTVLSEIYKTQLNPLISFLHEPGERRFSLSLDIAEIFKPLLADRIIFTLINRKQIQEKHFVKNTENCFLNENGRRLFLQEYDEKLKTVIKHRSLQRNVSYRHLIRLECYKLIKHIIEGRPYKPFVIWW